MKKLFTLLILVLSMTACNGLTAGDPGSATDPSVTPESDPCNTPVVYSPGVVVSGTATFRKRGFRITNSGVGMSAYASNITLGSVIPTLLPIKYAEVRVLLTSNSTLVQCGMTDALGQIKALDGVSDLKIPNSAGDYTVQVLSRSNYTFSPAGKPTNSTLFVSVKEDIYSNTVYNTSAVFNSHGSGGASNTAVALIAQAQESISSKVEGGAFNIYNDWVTAFEYLTSSANTAALDVSCLSHKLDIYWKAGFNPYQYAYPNEDPAQLDPLSFYLRSDFELYINGGKLGNITSEDTDHFDDTVILHEMGHHIENACGTMDSPGGTHYAQYRIDPRLAWSEGWGNFMGAHIMKNNIAKINPDLPAFLPNNEWLHYNDTKGYIDTGITTGTSLILMKMNKNGNGSGSGSTFDAVNSSSFPGESHTREGSISRGLFKGTNTCVATANCIGDIGFDKYWIALGRTSQGMGVTSSPFRSSAKFFAKVKAANSNTFSNSANTMLSSDEALQLIDNSVYTVAASSTANGNVSANTWPGYGIELTTNNSCNETLLQPRNTNYTNDDESDQRFSNHFYFIKKSDLSGVTAINLVPDSSCPVDLDLIVFNESYSFNEDCTAYDNSGNCSAFQKTTSSSNIATLSRSSQQTESVNISLLGSGNYLLNVRGFSSNPSGVSSSAKCLYKLTDQNGGLLCPSTSY